MDKGKNGMALMLYDFFKALWDAIFSSEEESEVYDNVPAYGWDAVFANHKDGITTRPVIFWKVTESCDNVSLMAVGMVFVNNRPPCVEQVTESPNFIGYQRVSNESKPSSLALAYESFNEWS